MPKSETDLKHFRLLLVKLRDELMEAEQSGFDETRIGGLTKIDAQRRRKIQIRKIEAAWQRMKNGEFGVCVHCENEMERLEFDPTTVFSRNVRVTKKYKVSKIDIFRLVTAILSTSVPVSQIIKTIRENVQCRYPFQYI